MHIADGTLSIEVVVVGAVVAVGAVGLGLKRLSYDRVPRVGVLASVFFVASLIHIRIGPSSAHLLLNGLLGTLLGWAVFPALAAALFLQALLLGFGGVTVLGPNVIIMGVPAVIVYYATRVMGGRGRRMPFLRGVVAGGGGVLLSCVFMALALCVSDAESYAKVAKALLIVHLPVIVIESIVSGAALAFLYRVYPAFLEDGVSCTVADGGVGGLS